MKKILLPILKNILRYLAKLTLARHKPVIIGVTGTVGKTSAKLAIASVLGRERHVRVSPGNFNNELGVPLTILGDYKEVKGKLFWIHVVIHSALNLFRKEVEYPEILVLEYGIDHPYDMKYLLSIAEPNVGVVTALGQIPVHVEFFSSPDQLFFEKARLIEALPRTGFAILNYDDESVMRMEARTEAQIMSYGFGKGATIRIANFAYRNDGGSPSGVYFRLEYGSVSIPVELPGVFGKVQAYAAAAAAAVGLISGMSFSSIADALREYRPAKGRGEFLPGIKGTLIINDTYNASPLSTEAALDALKNLPGKRKVAILGDMLELGKYAIEAHEGIGRVAADSAHLIVTIGPRAKFIAESARASGHKKDVHSFDTAEEARTFIQDVIKEGDLILIKASRAMHLEKIVEEIEDLTKTKHLPN